MTNLYSNDKLGQEWQTCTGMINLYRNDKLVQEWLKVGKEATLDINNVNG